MDAKIKRAAALDWAMHERAWQFGLDDIYTAIMYMWLPLIDEIKAAGRYDEYLKICLGI